MRDLLALFAAVAVTVTNGLAEDPAPKPRLVAIPVTGAQAACCTAAVKEALQGLPAVASVRIESADGAKVAIVTLKKEQELLLSDVQRVLDEAANDMAIMMGGGIKYLVSREHLLLGEGAFVVGSRPIDPKSLEGVAGVASAAPERAGDLDGIRLHLAPKSDLRLASIVLVLERTGNHLADLVLAPNFDPSTTTRPQQPKPPQAPPKGNGGGGGGC